MIGLLLALAGAVLAADKGDKPSLSQDITVRSRAGGPGVMIAPPAASKPVVDEVLDSLSLGRGARGPAASRYRAGTETARFARPFPEPPYLALSPENIDALYDEWTFEVFDSDGELAWKNDGVGVLQDNIDWEGSGPNGRLAIVAGKSYHYRFTARRGGRAFVVESDPVLLKSFVHREYVGETRLEVASAVLFEDGKAAFAKSASPYLAALATRLRTGDARADGSYKIELYSAEPRGKLALARARALASRLAADLVVSLEKVKAAALPAGERGEAVAAFVPPAKGAGLRIE